MGNRQCRSTAHTHGQAQAQACCTLSSPSGYSLLDTKNSPLHIGCFVGRMPCRRFSPLNISSPCKTCTSQSCCHHSGYHPHMERRRSGRHIPHLCRQNRLNSGQGLHSHRWLGMLPCTWMGLTRTCPRCMRHSHCPCIHLSLRRCCHRCLWVEHKTQSHCRLYSYQSVLNHNHWVLHILYHTMLLMVGIYMVILVETAGMFCRWWHQHFGKHDCWYSWSNKTQLFEIPPRHKKKNKENFHVRGMQDYG